MDNRKMPKPWYKIWWVWLIIVLAVFIVSGIAGGGSDNSSSSNNSSPKTEKTTSSKSTGTQSSEASDSSSSTKATPKVPIAYKNALESAETYANSMNLSKRAIYEQLRSKAGDQFSTKVAYYAVTHLKDVNWNRNALESAKTYQKDINMSPAAIRDQLTSSAGDKFTQAQANYAVSHLPK